jgi:antitoxin (DNA-binding transcriptional repressor) of toxin-antitoxin stability system
METVSIRDLRGADLQERARAGKPLAITNRRALIGVIIPASSAWVEHLVVYNWPRVHQSITEGEQAIADDPATPGADGGPERPDGGAERPGGDNDHDVPGRPVVPLDAMVVGETVVQAPASVAAIGQLWAALNPLPSAGRPGGGWPEPSFVRPIRIGDLSAAQIEKAGVNGQTLAVTHDRKLIGILIPVTQGLVHFLIERNISSVLDNIRYGEDLFKGTGAA